MGVPTMRSAMSAKPNGLPWHGRPAYEKCYIKCVRNNTQGVALSITHKYSSMDSVSLALSLIAVGTKVTFSPPHGPRRAGLPHRVLPLCQTVNR